jgi:hypothetical protein
MAILRRAFDEPGHFYRHKLGKVRVRNATLPSVGPMRIRLGLAAQNVRPHSATVGGADFFGRKLGKGRTALPADTSMGGQLAILAAQMASKQNKLRVRGEMLFRILISLFVHFAIFI